MILKLNRHGAALAIAGMTSKNPIFIVVIGPPGSGKTTFAESLKTNGFKFDHVSSDHSDSHFVEKKMKFMLRKYNEAIAWRRNLLLDQTNMTMLKRRGYINNAASWGYECIAVDLVNVPPEVMIGRCKHRELEGGRGMPADVIYDLYQKYEPPSETEGFDIIYQVQP